MVTAKYTNDMDREKPPKTPVLMPQPPEVEPQKPGVMDVVRGAVRTVARALGADSGDKICPNLGCRGHLRSYGREILALKGDARLMQCALNPKDAELPGHGCEATWISFSFDGVRINRWAHLRIVNPWETYRGPAEALLEAALTECMEEKRRAEEAAADRAEKERVAALGTKLCCFNLYCPLYHIEIPGFRVYRHDTGLLCHLCNGGLMQWRADEVKPAMEWLAIVAPGFQKGKK